MGARLIHLGESRAPATDDLVGLGEKLLPLLRQPSRFLRVSYGDELTLHFGDLRDARSPKLAGKPYGAFVLGLRASFWTLSSGTSRSVVVAESGQDSGSGAGGRGISPD